MNLSQSMRRTQRNNGIAADLSDICFAFHRAGMVNVAPFDKFVELAEKVLNTG